MFDQQARLDRVLARHPDAAVVEPLPGRPALIRRDQILVVARTSAAAEDLVRRWFDSREDERGVTRLRLRAPRGWTCANSPPSSRRTPGPGG